MTEKIEPNTMNFTLLTRKGNKQSFRNLSVPVSSELALNLRCQEQVSYYEGLIKTRVNTLLTAEIFVL